MVVCPFMRHNILEARTVNLSNRTQVSRLSDSTIIHSLLLFEDIDLCDV